MKVTTHVLRQVLPAFEIAAMFHPRDSPQAANFAHPEGWPLPVWSQDSAQTVHAKMIEHSSTLAA